VSVRSEPTGHLGARKSSPAPVTVPVTVIVTENQPIDWSFGDSFGDGRTHYFAGPPREASVTSWDPT